MNRVEISIHARNEIFEGLAKQAMHEDLREALYSVCMVPTTLSFL